MINIFRKPSMIEKTLSYICSGIIGSHNQLKSTNAMERQQKILAEFTERQKYIDYNFTSKKPPIKAEYKALD